MRSGRAVRARGRSALCGLHMVACALIAAGTFGPWVAHKTAALTVTGYEVSEFAKFFPQVQGGVVPLRRALFVVPLLTASVSLALTAQRSTTRPLPRRGATAFAVLLSLCELPPYPSFLAAAYRLQLVLGGVGILLTLLTPLARQISERVRGLLFLLLALAGAWSALWQIGVLHPLIVDLYGAPVWPGWGVVTCVIGLLLLLLTGLRDLLAS